jgi:hypothetical protein
MFLFSPFTCQTFWVVMLHIVVGYRAAVKRHFPIGKNWTLHPAFSTCGGMSGTPTHSFTCYHPDLFPISEDWSPYPSFSVCGDQSNTPTRSPPVTSIFYPFLLPTGCQTTLSCFILVAGLSPPFILHSHINAPFSQCHSLHMEVARSSATLVILCHITTQSTSI